MISKSWIPILATAPLLALAAVTSTPASAQAAGARVLKVPCCKCVDGNKLPVAIDTGRVSGWTVKNPNGTAFNPVVAANNAAWAPVQPASWVGPPGAPTTLGVYVYEFRFDVPRCVIPAGVSLAGRFGADNSAKVFFDGNQVAVSQGATNLGFQAASITPYTITGIGTGSHVLRVEVNNISSVTSLAMSGTITVACPKDPNAVASRGNEAGQLADKDAGCTGCSTS